MNDSRTYFRRSGCRRCPEKAAVTDGEYLDAVGRQGLDVLQQVGIAARAEDLRRTHREGVEGTSDAEGASDPVNEHGLAGTDLGLLQGRVGGAEVAETSSLLERDRAGKLRYAAWRTVIAGFVARRRGEQADDLLLALAGRVALASPCRPTRSGWPGKT